MLCYTVLQVAEICNISKKTVFRNIEKLNNNFIVVVDRVQDSVQYTVNSKVITNVTMFNDVSIPCNTKYLITETGLNYFKEKYSIDTVKTDSISHNDSMIEFLKKQIEIKDEQINKLLQQNNNYQVLIAEMQNNTLLIDSTGKDTEQEQPKRKKIFSFFKNNK